MQASEILKMRPHKYEAQSADDNDHEIHRSHQTQKLESKTIEHFEKNENYLTVEDRQDNSNF